jgi:SAM-dependent methyltransferase
MGWEEGYAPLEGWSNFQSLYQDAVNAAPAKGAVFVEMGVALGRSAFMMADMIAKSKKDITFFAIDLWDTVPARQWAGFANDFFGQFLEGAVKHARGLLKHVRILRLDSVAASKAFADASLDFCFIDGEHWYDPVRRDILTWLPKVKPGGVIAGHDYDQPQLKRAVIDIFGEGRVEPVATSWRVRV